MTVTTLTFKVTAAEARRIRKMAKAENLTLSEFLRRRMGGRTGPDLKPGLVRCTATGATVFAPFQDGAPFTTETVKEWMGDFP